MHPIFIWYTNTRLWLRFVKISCTCFIYHLSHNNLTRIWQYNCLVRFQPNHCKQNYEYVQYNRERICIIWLHGIQLITHISFSTSKIFINSELDKICSHYNSCDICHMAVIFLRILSVWSFSIYLTFWIALKSHN